MVFENHMNFEQFLQAAKEFFEKRYQDKGKVDIRPVLKNNGVYLHGLSVIMKDDQVVPAIYLESFYEQYQKGIPFEQLMEQIESVYAANTNRRGISADYYKQYETVQDSLRLKLINYQKNEVFLEQVPFVKFLDLALVCYSRFPEPDIADGVIVVKKKHLELWKVTQEQLFEQALGNSRRQEKELFAPMFDLMCSLQDAKPEDLELEEDPKLYVLTNQSCLFGAAALYYPGVLFECANQLESDFYILPSSVHEVLFLKTEDGEVERLRKMVEEVNKERILEEDVLSDHVYRYDWKRQTLRDLDTGEEMKL